MSCNCCSSGSSERKPISLCELLGALRLPATLLVMVIFAQVALAVSEIELGWINILAQAVLAVVQIVLVVVGFLFD